VCGVPYDTKLGLVCSAYRRQHTNVDNVNLLVYLLIVHISIIEVIHSRHLHKLLHMNRRPLQKECYRRSCCLGFGIHQKFIVEQYGESDYVEGSNNKSYPSSQRFSPHIQKLSAV